MKCFVYFECCTCEFCVCPCECVCQTVQPDLIVVSDRSSIVADKHGCIIFVCSRIKHQHICIYPTYYTYNDIHVHLVARQATKLNQNLMGYHVIYNC